MVAKQDLLIILFIILSLTLIFNALYSKGLNILALDEKYFLHIKHFHWIFFGSISPPK